MHIKRTIMAGVVLLAMVFTVGTGFVPATSAQGDEGFTPYIPNDQFFVSLQLPFYAQTRVDQFWGRFRSEGIPGSPVTVAFIDSARGFTNDDLMSKRWLGANGESGITFLDPSEQDLNDPDPNGHFHQVAGNLGADGDNQRLVAGILFLLPNVRIIPLQALNRNLGGSLSTIVPAIDWVAEHAAQYNIRVVNCSFEVFGLPSDVLQAAILRLNDAGVAVAFASGNEGINLNSMRIGCLANLPNVIFVGGSIGDQIASDSNYGDQVVMAYAPREGGTLFRDNGLGYGGGTSHATSTASSGMTAAASLRPDLGTAHLLVAQLLAATNRNALAGSLPLVDLLSTVYGQYNLRQSDAVQIAELAFYKKFPHGEFKKKTLVLRVRSDDPSARFTINASLSSHPDYKDELQSDGSHLISLKTDGNPGTILVASSGGTVFRNLTVPTVKKRK